MTGLTTTGTGDAPPEVEDRLRAICSTLPDAYEETAWLGLRWRVRGRTILHVLTVQPSRPRSHAQLIGRDVPTCMMTFRAPVAELAALTAEDGPCFRAHWGENVVGMVLDADTDWTEVAELVTDSYRVLAPRKLVALLPPMSGRPSSPGSPKRSVPEVPDG